MFSKGFSSICKQLQIQKVTFKVLGISEGAFLVVQRYREVLQMEVDSEFYPRWESSALVHGQNCMSWMVEEELGSPWLCSHCTVRSLFAQISDLQPDTKSVKSV